ncbi:MAG: HEAT repeat domain-containing protein [Deltaproteobacteria bacterium]|nr:HEAT repeat domain-containing protein [Deltaproteobacteria bacterium]
MRGFNGEGVSFLSGLTVAGLALGMSVRAAAAQEPPTAETTPPTAEASVAGEPQPAPLEPVAPAGVPSPTYEDRVAQLASPEEEVRAEAVRALSELANPAAVPVLAATLTSDASEKVRRYAVVALANLGGPEAMAAILSAARGDLSEAVRAWAEEAVRRLDEGQSAAGGLREPAPAGGSPEPPPPVVQEGGDVGASWTLAEALRQVSSGHTDRRMAAVRRIAALGDQTAVPVLVTRLRLDENVEVRRLIVVTLVMLGGDMALEAVVDAARNDPSLVVQANAREALERIGVPVGTVAARPEEARPGDGAWGGGEPAEPDSALLGAGDIRLGGHLALTALWREWSVSAAGAAISEDDSTVSFGLAPVFGYFVLSWLELGLELDIGYGSGEFTRRTEVSGMTTTATTESSTVSILLLPHARAHIAVTNHVFFSLAVLLGYGHESTETGPMDAPSEDRVTATADGLVVGPEVGLEIAVDHVLIPIWLRVFYRPWSLTTSDAPNLELDVGDVLLGFGTGLHVYF